MMMMMMMMMMMNDSNDDDVMMIKMIKIFSYNMHNLGVCSRFKAWL